MAGLVFPENDDVQQVLQLHATWLRGLRWVSRAEAVLLWASLVLITSAVALALAQSSLLAVCAALAHLLLTLAAATLASRRTCVFWLGFFMLSLVNHGITFMRGMPGLESISLAYCAIGVIAMAAALATWQKMKRGWLGIAEYQARDDFRWLVAEAPLVLRFRVVIVLASLAEQ